MASAAGGDKESKTRNPSYNQVDLDYNPSR